jgi:predicted ATPase
MLNCYRRDFSALRNVIADIRHLTEGHHLPSLAATAQILEGWCEGNAGYVMRGRDMIRQGLAIHAELQTPEDYPVYCGMLAELLAQTGEIDEALALLLAAAA